MQRVNAAILEVPTVQMPLEADQVQSRTLGVSLATRKTIFLVGLTVCAGGLVSPPLALLAGIAFGFSLEHPLRAESHALARFLLQASVVALGFGMNLREVLHAGSSGFVYTAVGITVAMVLGLSLGAMLRVGGRASFLITAGTAICGGSAIAAIAPINGAGEEEISVAMGTVFVLNSVALFIFPAIGAHFHLSQSQFGLWAALAIHDTSSVVGATARYGAQALAVGTTVKLARALWIIPVSLLTGLYVAKIGAKIGAKISARAGRGAPGSAPRVHIPWFIFLFGLAAAAPLCAPQLGPAYRTLYGLGRTELAATLFLIGSSLSYRTLRQVGVRPMAQGIVLWLLVGSATLFAVCRNIIHL